MSYGRTMPPARTAGALIGAYVTYRMSERAGEHWLQKRIGPKRSRQVQGLFKQWGVVALFAA
jgi:membrane protein DedA with SNARE-associated domain